jgi:hypothetical protein
MPIPTTGFSAQRIDYSVDVQGSGDLDSVNFIVDFQTAVSPNAHGEIIFAAADDAMTEFKASLLAAEPGATVTITRNTHAFRDDAV